MSEKKNLAQSIAAFSKKFSKLGEEDKDNYETPLSKEKLLQYVKELSKTIRHVELRGID